VEAEARVAAPEVDQVDGGGAAALEGSL